MWMQDMQRINIYIQGFQTKHKDSHKLPTLDFSVVVWNNMRKGNIKKQLNSIGNLVIQITQTQCECDANWNIRSKVLQEEKLKPLIFHLSALLNPVGQCGMQLKLKSPALTILLPRSNDCYCSSTGKNLQAHILRESIWKISPTCVSLRMSWWGEGAFETEPWKLFTGPGMDTQAGSFVSMCVLQCA